MQVDTNCIFCKIVKGELPAKIIEETGDLIAFHDLNPMAPVHVLMIPKLHVASVDDLSDETSHIVGGLTLMAQKIAKRLDIRSGYRLVLNTGKDSGQTVFHLHMHLLGGRQMAWPPG